jgi:Ca2+-binding RTX toxin-like protein
MGVNSSDVKALLSDQTWRIDSSRILTYSFYESSVFKGIYYGSETGVSEVSENVKANLRAIINWLETIINLDFVELIETNTNIYGTLRLMNSNGPNYAYAYYPSSSYKIGGDIHIKTSYDTYNLNDNSAFQNPAGFYGYMAIVHELGHALGLKHTHETVGEYPVLRTEINNSANSVMTYNNTGKAPGTFMPLDIAALQLIYGEKQKNTGNDTYLFSDVSHYKVNGQTELTTTYATKQTIWDTGGNDTLDLSALAFDGKGYRLDMNENGLLTKNTLYNAYPYQVNGDGRTYYTTSELTAIAFGITLENANGSSSIDNIIGNNANNVINGNAGNDNLFSGAGNDLLIGGAGNDYLNGDMGFDIAEQIGFFKDYKIVAIENDTILTNKYSGETDTFTNLERIHFKSFGNVNIASSPGEALSHFLVGTWLHRDLSSSETEYVQQNLASMYPYDIINVFLTLPETFTLTDKSSQTLLAGFDNTQRAFLLQSERHFVGSNDNERGFLPLGWTQSVDGGKGFDVLDYTDKYTNVKWQVNNHYVELSRSGDSTLLSLKNVEMVVFDNGQTLALAHNSAEGVLGRLVHTFLNRDATADEWRAGTDALKQNVDPETIFRWFQSHATGLAQLNDKDYVQALYSNTFHRTATDAELGGHLVNLANGGIDRNWLAVDLAKTEEAVIMIGSVLVMDGWV